MIQVAPRLVRSKDLYSQEDSTVHNDEQNTFAVNLLECKGDYSATSNNMKLVHYPLTGGLLHLVHGGSGGASYGAKGLKPPQILFKPPQIFV